MGYTPSVRARRLIVELKRLRKKSGITLGQVAEELNCSPAKVSRMELGEAQVRPRDARDMLAMYGVTGAEADPLIELAKETRTKGWWHTYADVLPKGFRTYAGLEAEATLVRTYQSQLVPGLLQSEAYVRAVINADPVVGPDEIEQRVAARIARQEVLLRGDVQLQAILDEAVLRRMVGTPKVMREQLQDLVVVSRRHNILLQVLSFESGAHPALSGAFHILGFAELSDPSYVYLDNAVGGTFVDDAEWVRRVGYRFDHLQAKAYDIDESVDLIAKIAGEYIDDPE